MSTQLSSKQQLSRIAAIIYQYLRLPLSDENIPGSFLEGVLAHVRDGERLNTYDFVDVINREEKIGWQIKSTKESTPVTWKRAKIPNSAQLIKASHESQKNLQQLGTAIINFCNQHAEESIQRYGLDEIYYSRLITFDNGSIKYFERKLCDKNNPQMFDPNAYEWKWSTPKSPSKKEQLSALHGIDRQSRKKVWAWHGLGENQLHFSGESEWWGEKANSYIEFRYPPPNQRLTLEKLVALLEGL